MDGWSAAFLVAFLVGLLFTGVGVFLGGHHGLGRTAHPGHVGHVGHAGQTGAHAHAPAHRTGREDAPSPLNPLLIAAFVGSGGGVAYLLHEGAGLHPLLAAFGGGVAGFGVASLLFTVFVRVFIENAGDSTRSAYELVDSPATVSVAVPSVGTGRIDFVSGGRRQTMGARSATGEAIRKGSAVVVLRLEHGIAYVAATGDEKEESWS